MQATKNDTTVSELRTVFKVDWDAPNTTQELDVANNLLFEPKTGSDRDQCEFNWDGENGAWWVAAKMEHLLRFTPACIDWSARGVYFIYSTEPGSKFRFRLQRLRLATILTQSKVLVHRIVFWNEHAWVYDFDSGPDDAQNPDSAEPNKAFRTDAPGFDADVYLQMGMRADFREVAEWHNGQGWSRISPLQNAEWHVNATSVLPDGGKGGENNHGPGATASDVPNTRPVAKIRDDEVVRPGAKALMYGFESSDADNDTWTYQWRQISGPEVDLQNADKEIAWFVAPDYECDLTFGLKVSDITKDLHRHNPGNYESQEATWTIYVRNPSPSPSPSPTP